MLLVLFVLFVNVFYGVCGRCFFARTTIVCRERSTYAHLKRLGHRQPMSTVRAETLIVHGGECLENGTGAFLKLKLIIHRTLPSLPCYCNLPARVEIGELCEVRT